MGRNRNFSEKTRKMKLSLALAAMGQVFNFSSNNWSSFAAAVDSVDDSQWQPLWQFCNADGSAALSTTELTTCGARAANYLGMPESQQNFLYKFAGKYVSVIDQDGSGDLSYDEFRYTFGGFAATDAGVIMALFDGDSDGKLNAEELSEWKAKIQELMAQWGWNPTSDTKACLRNAWTAANKNGNVNDATRQEIALFTLGTWNCMLQ